MNGWREAMLPNQLRRQRTAIRNKYVAEQLKEMPAEKLFQLAQYEINRATFCQELGDDVSAYANAFASSDESICIGGGE